MNYFTYFFSICLLLLSPLNYSQWMQQNSGTTKGLYSICFLNENIGWIAGEDGTILKTTDAGNSWISQSISTPDNIRIIFFTDSLNGWVDLYEWTPFRHGSIYHTTDGGDSWFSQFTIADYGLLSLFFTDNLNGWVVGTNGIAFKTNDGGNTWQQMYIETFGGWLYSVRFVNNNYGWAVGEMFGQVAKTTDGGNYWFNQNIPTYYYIIDSYFSNENFGWCVGSNGTIVATSDGGNTWLTRTSGVTNELRDILFVNENSGWIAGFGGVILHSNNGGLSWSQQSSNTTDDIYNINFVSESTGWAVGENGLILHTINGGIPVELIAFTGSIYENNIILNWETATETNNKGFEILRDGKVISFISGSGTSTEPQSYSLTDEDVSPGTYTYSLVQIDFDGTRDRIGELQINMNNNVSEYSFAQNYPNPFNPSTTIKYSIPQTSQVQIKIFDILGNEIKTLLNEEKTAGIYQIEFDGSNIQSGIYFYRIFTGKFTETKKMVLMK